jgi:hypothetical protein
MMIALVLDWRQQLVGVGGNGSEGLEAFALTRFPDLPDLRFLT